MSLLSDRLARKTLTSADLQKKTPHVESSGGGKLTDTDTHAHTG